MDQNIIDMREILQNKFFSEDDLPRSGSIHPEYSHTMMICVDSFQNRLASGRIHTYFFEEETTFGSLDQMLFGIEEILDKADEAQRDTQLATSFDKKIGKKVRVQSGEEFYADLAIKKCKKQPPAFTPETLNARAGELASYYIRVLARQHSSMQGIISRCEKGGAATFRSEMELLTLIRKDLFAEVAWSKSGASE